jgi:hypothetical protein
MFCKIFFTPTFPPLFPSYIFCHRYNNDKKSKITKLLYFFTAMKTRLKRLVEIGANGSNKSTTNTGL